MGSIRHTKGSSIRERCCYAKKAWVESWEIWSQTMRSKKSWEGPQGNGDCRDKAKIWKRSQGRVWSLEERNPGNLYVLRTSELQQMVM